MYKRGMAYDASRLTVCTPLWVEYWAARRGLPKASQVVRTGMGPARSGEAINRLGGHDPVAIVGVAGGLVSHILAGDVVVASAVMTAEGDRRECDDVSGLAERISELGLTVHVGPIVSTPDIATGAARSELASRHDAIATDMESGYLADALANRAVAVVRVVVDTTDQPLFRPGVVPRGIKGLANLRRAVAALPAWAAQVTGSTAADGTL